MATAHAVDVQKQRYSKELAEYTYRQYDQARQSVDGGKQRSSPPSSHASSPSRNGQPSITLSHSLGSVANGFPGVQVADYARRSRAQ